jgi:hypothetical protein
MMKKLLRFLTVIILFVNFSSAQELFFKQKPLLFFEEKSKQIIVIENDSLIIKINEKVKIPLKCVDYPKNLRDYIPFTIKKRNYFVHSGCGVVLEFRNDSIVRIDNSLMHNNQFGAATFVYKDEIYFFGGYGLFTTKNILTKFDFKLKEWVLVEISNDNNSPYLTDAYSIKLNDKFYVFGGYKSVNSQIINNEDYVYCLDLKNFSWEKTKTNFFIENKNVELNEKNRFYYKDNIIINKLNELVSVDFNNNQVIRYKNSLPYPIEHYSLVVKDELFAILDSNNHIKPGYFILKSFHINDILKNPISEVPFYYEERPYYLFGFMLLFVLLLSVLSYKKRRFISYYLNPTIPFQYWQETELLYFKGKKVKHLSDDDIKILNKMALHPNQFISLNEFNEMFTIDYENENYSAIVKRREKKLETFLQMIANVSSYDFQDLIHERKNEVDKRIKEVLFLPKKIKFVKK